MLVENNVFAIAWLLAPVFIFGFFQLRDYELNHLLNRIKTSNFRVISIVVFVALLFGLIFIDIPLLQDVDTIRGGTRLTLPCLLIGYGVSLINFPESATFSLDLLKTKDLGGLGLFFGFWLIVLGIAQMIITNKALYNV